MGDLRRLEERVRSAGGLPVFNQTLQKALELIRSEAPMPDIAKAIEGDPGIAGRILKLANSAYYGMSREVATLKMALILLGARAVRSLILSIGLVEILDEAANDAGYPGPDFREHSVLTGRLASVLSRIHGLQFQSEEFVTGLVHDVGKLVLLQAFRPEVEASASRLRGCQGPELLEAEQELFDLTHPEAGAWAATAWSLPPAIVEAIRQHHDPSPSPAETPTLSDIIRAANRLAHWCPLLQSDPETEWPTPWSEDPILGHPDLTRETLLRENTTELA